MRNLPTFLLKICTQCKRELPLTEFSAHKLGWCGFRAECKECNRAATALYRKKNWLKVRENAYKWRRENPERWKELKKKSYKAHPETLRAQRKRNALKIRANTRRWQIVNPHKVKINCIKRRAMKMNASGSHSVEQWLSRVSMFLWKCAYCGTKLDSKTATQDHRIPLVRGGTNWPSNLVPACLKCNVDKNRFTPKEFFLRRATP